MSKDPYITNHSTTRKMLVDILAGTIAGIAVTLVGQPFDTLKVRLQTQPVNNPVYKGLVDCFKKTIQWEGVSGLYKGIASPLVGQMFFRANLFFAFGRAKDYFSNYNTRQIKPIEYFYCGSIAWGLGALTECPIDFFKTQLQVQIVKAKSDPNYKPVFNGLFDCVRKIIAKNGILGVYQGFVPHLLRNIPAGALHLGAFENIRNYYANKYNVKPNHLKAKYTLLAGSVGGFLFWIVNFPQDVIKSSMQGDSPDKANRKYKGFLDTINKLYKEGGIKRFYKGLSPCMLRSVPANAIMLYTSSYISENF